MNTFIPPSSQDPSHPLRHSCITPFLPKQESSLCYLGREVSHLQYSPSDLPQICLEIIFKHLTLKESGRARLICHKWNSVYPTTFRFSAMRLYKMRPNTWNLLSIVGIQRPATKAAAEANANILVTSAYTRLRKINLTMPETLQYRGPMEDLILNENELETFLTTLLRLRAVKLYRMSANTWDILSYMEQVQRPATEAEAETNANALVNDICTHLREINLTIPETHQYRGLMEDLILNENELENVLGTWREYSKNLPCSIL